MELGVSYIAEHDPSHIEADVKEMAEIGCTEVLFALQENHLLYLNGALKYGAGMAKERGIRPYVVIWGFANTFGGGQISRFMMENLNLWRRSEDWSYVPKACLNNPGVVDKFVEFTDLCRSNGFEGVFVDEPTPQECFCDICRGIYTDDFNGDIVKEKGTPEYEAFRRQSVRRYTQNVSKSVKALDPSLITIACVMPSDKECFEAVGTIPELDVFGTDPYWLLGDGWPLEQAVEYTRTAKEICDQTGKKSQVWLNCWAIPEGREPQIYSGGKALGEVGCDSMYAWAFKGAAGTNESCPQPEIAWSYLTKLYKELSGK